MAIELRLARSARCAYVIESGAVDAFGVHERGCRAHDPIASRQATPRQAAGLDELVSSARLGRHPRTGSPASSESGPSSPTLATSREDAYVTGYSIRVPLTCAGTSGAGRPSSASREVASR